MAPDRWVVIDDTNPSIKYTGSWSQDSGSHNSVGNFGPPYLHTLHGTSVNGSVEFEFNGTAIEVLGTNIVKDAKTSPDPTFECFVDNVSIGRSDPFEFDENNWNFCGKTQLPDGHHTLRIDVVVVSTNQTFWLDQLRYIPSPNLPLDNQVILFDNTDPAIQLDSQWVNLGGGANMTTHTNSIAQVNFVGTSVSWFAFVPRELPHTGATGTWAIDGGNATQFLLSGLPASATNTIYNQLYFTTPPVEAGAHTLTLTFLGNGQTTPLCLDYIYVQNGTFPTSTNSTTTTPDPSPQDNSGPPSSASHIGAILGGVLGGLAFLVIVAGSLLFWKRRKANQKEKFISTEGSEYSPTPFGPYNDDHRDSMAQIHQPQSYAAPNASALEVTPLVLAPPAQQQSRAMRKQQEAFGRTGVYRTLNEGNSRIGHAATASTGTSSSWPQTTTTETSAVRQHMDSGLRLEAQPPSPIVDVPPHYTPE